MHPSRLTILGGTALTAFALLLPFISAPLTGGVNGFEGAAWPALALLGVPALLSLGGDRREGFGRPASIVAILAAAVATVFALAKLIDAVLAVRDIRLIAGEASMGSGAWVLIIACVVALAGSLLTLSRRIV